jgi:uncharacterized protein (TIGR00369 family)
MNVIPRNKDFETVVRKSFARQNLMHTLGAELVRIAPGEADIAMPYARDFCQQAGFLHAGAISSIADSASGYAALTLCPPGTDVLSVEFKINLMAPAKAARFLAQGRVIRPGKSLTVCLADVYGLDGDKRSLIATMLSTIVQRTFAPVRSC